MHQHAVVASAENRGYVRRSFTRADHELMGHDSQWSPQPLSKLELQTVAHALELCLPDDGIVKAEWWPGTEGKRNYRIVCFATEPAPLCRTWIAERSGTVFRLMGRPANSDELDELFAALRELGTPEPEGHGVAEAFYDCRGHTYQLYFTPLEEMHEGLPYRRYVFRRHSDGRPLSVGYICETRRDDAYLTLPGAEILRGNPWRD